MNDVIMKFYFIFLKLRDVSEISNLKKWKYLALHEGSLIDRFDYYCFEEHFYDVNRRRKKRLRKERLAWLLAGQSSSDEWTKIVPMFEV